MASSFKSSGRSLTLTLLVGVLSLAACAPPSSQNSSQHLPDDPSQEPAAQTGGGSPSVPSGAATPPLPPFENVDNSRTSTDPLAKYQFLDPNHLVPTKLLADAVAYYDLNLSRITNKKTLTIVDFSQPSNMARMFLIDMVSGAVWAIHVAHGKGSDLNGDGIAERFSNVIGSNASSLGFYLTAETYIGNHGNSLRLDGLSTTNSNVRVREVVIHGASYVQDRNIVEGRSWGCLAVAETERDQVVALLKGGSLIYAGLSGH